MNVTQKFQLVKTYMLVLMLCVSACVMDYNAPVAILKNNTGNRILIAKQPDTIMTDSILYNERFSESGVEAHSSYVISLPNIKLSIQPDSAKVYLFLFNSNTVYKHQVSKHIQGIMKNSFIRKIKIQLNKVKEPLDTIFIK